MMIHYEIPVWESCHCILYFRVHVSMTTGNDVYMCCAQSVPVTISAREWSDRFSPIQSGGWNRPGRWPRYRSYVSLTVCTVALLYRSYKGYLFTRVTQSIITGNGQATSVYAYLYIYILYPYVLTLGKADTYHSVFLNTPMWWRKTSRIFHIRRSRRI